MEEEYEDKTMVLCLTADNWEELERKAGLMDLELESYIMTVLNIEAER